MPQMDGLTATRRIREYEQQEGRSRYLIIALIAAAFDEDRQACLDAGMDDVLVNPVGFVQVRQVVNHWAAAAEAVE